MAFIARRVVVVFNGMATWRPSMINITFVDDIILIHNNDYACLDCQVCNGIISGVFIPHSQLAVMSFVSSSGRWTTTELSYSYRYSYDKQKSVTVPKPSTPSHSCLYATVNDMRTQLQLVTRHLYTIFMCTCVSTDVVISHRTPMCRNVAFSTACIWR